MNCPVCDGEQLRVLHIRRDTCESVVRIRMCRNCEHRWPTVEVELPDGAVKWTNFPYSTLRRVPGFKRVNFS